MSTVVSKGEGGTEFKNVSEGLHPATCVHVIDLGLQVVKYDGEETDKDKVRLQFEVHDENIEIDNEEKPMIIGKDYTKSLHEKSNLTKDLISWRGKHFTDAELMGFELKNVLGAPCQILVTHATVGEKTYANISSIVPYPKGVEKPVPINTLIHYDIDESNSDEVLDTLPEWLQKRIKNSKSYARLHMGGLFEDEKSDFEPLDDEQMPF